MTNASFAPSRYAPVEKEIIEHVLAALRDEFPLAETVRTMSVHVHLDRKTGRLREVVVETVKGRLKRERED